MCALVEGGGGSPLRVVLPFVKCFSKSRQRNSARTTVLPGLFSLWGPNIRVYTQSLRFVAKYMFVGNLPYSEAHTVVTYHEIRDSR